MRQGQAPVAGLSRHSTARYAVNGAICAAINNVILIVGDRLGGNHLFLVFLTWLIGSSVGFALHARISFRAPLRLAGYVQFMAGGAFGMPLAFALLVFLADICRLPMVIAAPIMTAIMILYNYLNARLAIIRRPS